MDRLDKGSTEDIVETNGGHQPDFPLRNRQAQADDVRSRLVLRQSKDTLVRSKSQVEVDVQMP